MFYINLLAILVLCFKTRRKMLVFVRPSFLPLLWISVFHSTIYSLCFPLKPCIMLSSGRKTHGYGRYSPLLYFPPLFCLIGRCSRRWSSGSGVPRRRLLRRRVLHRPGVVSEAPRQEASPFRSVSLLWFVLAFLRQNLTNYVCTKILWFV